MTDVSPTMASVATAGPPDLVLIDDHPLLADALARRFEAGGLLVEIGEVSVGRQRLLDDVIGHSPRLVLLDLGLPLEGEGEALIGPLVEAGLAVAVLTGETDRLRWARCSAAGARAVLSKTEPLEQLTATIERLLDGEPVRPHQQAELAALRRQDEEERRRRLADFDQLTVRECQVLTGLLAGRGLRLLADDHGVSIETIRSQAKSLMRKLGVASQLEVVARANAAGWTGG